MNPHHQSLGKVYSGQTGAFGVLRPEAWLEFHEVLTQTKSQSCVGLGLEFNAWEGL